MAKTLTFDVQHHLSKLHDELLAEIPEVRPVDGEAVMLVSGDGAHLSLTVPDDADEAAIQSVVDAHDPTPPEPPPDPEDELAAAIEAATDMESLKAALLGKNAKVAAAARRVKDTEG